VGRFVTGDAVARAARAVAYHRDRTTLLRPTSRSMPTTRMMTKQIWSVDAAAMTSWLPWN